VLLAVQRVQLVLQHLVLLAVQVVQQAPVVLGMLVASLPLTLRVHLTILTHLLLQVQHQDHLVTVVLVVPVVMVRPVVLVVRVLSVRRATRVVL
jgi:hypothetical protein